jgi:hypothetical protein
MKRLLLILLPLFLFVSCDSTYELINHKNNSIKMERDKDILVTTASNGFYENIEYKGSGDKTTQAIKNKLRPYAASVDISPADSFKKINADDLLNYDYIISPVLYHWEDRATNMNFMPDKLILGLTVYDNTGNIINYIEIKGESTKVTFANNDPIDLVNEALDMYIRQLFEMY